MFLSSGAIALFLSTMGVLLASRGDMGDPVGGVRPFVPGWLFVLYILSAVGGSIANNVGSFYSSGLCLQSLGLPLRRYQATTLDTVVSTAIVLYILLVQDFTSVLEHFVALLVVWLAPFAAVWLTDGRDAQVALRGGRDPRRQPAQPVLGLERGQPRRVDRGRGGRRRVPPDDPRADLQRPGERRARPAPTSRGRSGR